VFSLLLRYDAFQLRDSCLQHSEPIIILKADPKIESFFMRRADARLSFQFPDSGHVRSLVQDFI
jgi:hypothetical protein